MVHVNFKKILMAALMAAITITAHAQFATLGGERASIRWQYVDTPDYRIIYPVGMDSLAFRYGTLLQQYRSDVGRSAGFLPNQFFGKPMPVVIHPFTGESNGAVAGSPRRMEIYTLPDPYNQLSAMPWEQTLAIHENRHVAQMQVGYSGFWNWLYWPFGEIAGTIVDNYYTNAAMLEGDAVVAETALSESGRGRTADFLAYYRVAFDNHDYRNWYRWRYGSLTHFTPDHYALGYLTIAGVRTEYDAPMFMSDYMQRISNPFKGITALNKTVKQHTGKNIKYAWPELIKYYKEIWDRDDELRGPFQEMDVLTPEKRGYTVYRGAVAVSNNHRILAVRVGLDTDPQLVEISSHGIKSLRPFNADSRLVYSEHAKSIYWSEEVPDPRWEMEQDSRIRRMDLVSHRITDFTKDGRYANPAISPDGKQLAAVEYPVKGGSRAVVFDIDTGKELKSISAPDGLQFTEPAFWNGKLVLAGISADGTGLYLTDFSKIVTVMAPTHAKVRHLQTRPDGIYLSSDRNGTNEIYRFNPDTRKLVRKTNTKYGATEPFFLGEEMYFSALQPTGRLLSKADGDISVAVNPSDVYHYAIADELTQQEDAIRTTPKPSETSVKMTQPQEYKRLRNLFHIHSWMPFYYNTDKFYASYSEYTFQTAAFGATAFYQNLTGTASGSLGLSLHKNPAKSGLGLGVHGRMHYTGLYPVFDFALDIGDRPSAILQHMYDVNRDSLFLNVLYQEDTRIKRMPLYMGGKVTVSLPLSFSGGGWNTSVKPSLSMTSSTDLYYFPAKRVYYDPETENYNETADNYVSGVSSSLIAEARLSASTELEKAPSQVLPRLGAGADLSIKTNLMSSAWYGHVYGYIPGLFRTQGLKLSAEIQGSEMDVITANTYWTGIMEDLSPRGLTYDGIGIVMNRICPSQFKLSADYVIPAFSIDASITPYVYIRNFEFVPFFDFTRVSFLNNPKLPGESMDMYSVGMDINVRFEKLFYTSSTMKIGIRADYNGGSGYDYFADALGLERPFYIGPVINMEL